LWANLEFSKDAKRNPFVFRHYYIIKKGFGMPPFASFLKGKDPLTIQKLPIGCDRKYSRADDDDDYYYYYLRVDVCISTKNTTVDLT
jgi:hypothetical protein